MVEFRSFPMLRTWRCRSAAQNFEDITPPLPRILTRNHIPTCHSFRLPLTLIHFQPHLLLPASRGPLRGVTPVGVPRRSSQWAGGNRTTPKPTRVRRIPGDFCIEKDGCYPLPAAIPIRWCFPPGVEVDVGVRRMRVCLQKDW